MIHFDNVTKVYRLKQTSKVIVRNLSVSFPEKNIGLLGANGAGKSTLLRMISGGLLPDSGRITRDINVSWPLGFARSFNRKLTGAENVRFVARIYGRDTEHMRDFVEEFSELGEFFHMPVMTYSSGMKARLAFGVSMGVDFDCYLVDEITAVGDRRFKRRCRKMFKEKMSRSKIIMVSHSMKTIRDYCDIGAVVHDGNVVFYEDLEEAIAVHEENMAQ